MNYFPRGLPLTSHFRYLSFDSLTCRTGELIGCVNLQLVISELVGRLKEVRLSKESDVAVVRVSDGSVLIDTIGNWTSLDVVDLKVHETPLLSQDQFNEIQNRIDWDSAWTSTDVDAMYGSNIFEDQHGFITAYPIPLPPTEYDPSYKPQFLVVQRVSRDILRPVNEMQASVDEDARRIIIIAICLGLFGVLVVFSVASIVSRVTTRPLLWIDGVSSEILGHRKKDAFQTAPQQSRSGLKVMRTEVDELVEEFRKLVAGFSGDDAPLVAESEMNEVENEFGCREDIQRYLLEVRSSGEEKPMKTFSTDSTGNQIDASLSASNLSDSPVFLTTGFPQRVNIGQNIQVSHSLGLKTPSPRNNNRSYKSTLFWFIFCFIIAPLLLTNVAICIIVTQVLLNSIPTWIDAAATTSVALETISLEAVALTRAKLAEGILLRPIRDQFVHGRVASWLIFDGIKRSDSFTVGDQVADECKKYPPFQCPLTEIPSNHRTVCPCEWGDVQEQCSNDFAGNSRYLQYRHFHCQSTNADPETGFRNSTSYPKTDYSPNSTSWWHNISEIPGAEAGVNASGYSTTYDRLRVSSAMGVIEMPAYNYIANIGRPKEYNSLMLSFDADGLFTGFFGCGTPDAMAPHFQSTEQNEFAEVAPHLCPTGKFGYDPRCRSWYKEGQESYLNSNSGLYLSPPYLYGPYPIAHSAVVPVANPSSGEFVALSVSTFRPIGLDAASLGLDKNL